MARGSFLLIGGCTGGYPAFHQPLRPRYANSKSAGENLPEPSPGGLIGEPFDRNLTGGRTTSYLIRHEETFITIDQGAGVETIAHVLMQLFEAESIKQPVVHCLQTHFHEDHLTGIRVNRLLSRENLQLVFHLPDFSSVVPGVSTLMSPRAIIEEYLRFSFQPPFWPVDYVTLTEMGARRMHSTFVPGDSFAVDDVQVSTRLLNHPGGSTGYRIELPGGKTIAILTDFEPYSIRDSADFISGADLLLIDVQYTNAEYDGEAAIHGAIMSRKGWGHGCPRLTAPLFAACKQRPKMIRIVHHDPHHSDFQLAGLQGELAAECASHGMNPFDLEIARDGQWFDF